MAEDIPQDVGANGLALIKAFEGFHQAIQGGASAQAYKCPAGIWTIGWGHTGRVKDGQTATRDECEEMLRDDLQGAVRDVRKFVKTSLTQNQFDALVSFVFNCGPGNFSTSTLLKRVNAHAEPSDIAEAFLRFRKIKVDGAYKDSAGLARRRENEARLFNAPSDSAITISGDGGVSVSPASAGSASTSSGSTAYPGGAATTGPSMPQKPTAQPPKPLPQSRTIGGVIIAMFGAVGALFTQLTAGGARPLISSGPIAGVSPVVLLIGVVLFGLLIIFLARLTDQRRHTA